MTAVLKLVSTYIIRARRRGGRAAEGSALEKRYPVNAGSGVRIPPSPPITGKTVIYPATARLFMFTTDPEPQQRGEMAELAEGARLEIVCAVKGTEGSNPSLSASFYDNAMQL